jgi:hypothetical protein
MRFRAARAGRRPRVTDMQGAAPVGYQRTFPLTVPEPAAGLAQSMALAALLGLRRRHARAASAQAPTPR